MKISELMKLTEREIRNLDEADLRSAFSNVKRSVATRKTYFEKAGLQQNLPKTLRDAMAAGDLSASQIAKALGSARGYFAGKLSTAKGTLEFRKHQRDQLKSRLGAEDMTDAQLDQYGKFMKEMQNRYKENWKYVSYQAQKIALAASRRNLSMDQFLQNFDYWLNHEKDFEEMILERQDSEESDMMDDWFNESSEDPEDVMPAPAGPKRHAVRRTGRTPKSRQQRTGKRRR